MVATVRMLFRLCLHGSLSLSPSCVQVFITVTPLKADKPVKVTNVAPGGVARRHDYD